MHTSVELATRTSPQVAEHAWDGSSAADLLQSALRFARLLYYGRVYLVASVAVTCFLGVLYLATAPKIYQANAAVLVTQVGGDLWNTSLSPELARDTGIPTFEKLFSYPVVLENALGKLESQPAIARRDFEDIPREKWIANLRDNLRAVAARRTNIIDLSYRSLSREAAERVLNAVVDSYLEFIEKNHKNLSLEYVTILEQKRQEKEDELKQTQARLLEVQRQAGDLGLRSGTTVVHPLVQRAVRLNEAYVEVQKERLQLEALAEAIDHAVQTGGDLREHLITLEPIVGRELLLHFLGLNPQYAQAAGEMERRMMENVAKLAMLRHHYGPTHPTIVELQQTLANQQRFLREYQRRVAERVELVHTSSLGPMLANLVREKLYTVQAHERQLFQEYQEAEREAIALNDRMAELQILENNLQRLRNLHDTLLDRIANIDLKQNHADVRVALLSRPTALPHPVAPKKMLVFFLCTVVGLTSGAAIVYLRDLIDDRFRSPEEMKNQLGTPLLAMVRELTAEPDSQSGCPIYVHAHPTSALSEAFRTLRTTLAFATEEMNRLAVTSAEPGDGKTTISANLAAVYAQAGKRTVLIDADLRRPGLTKLFHMRKLPGLTDVLRVDDDVGSLCGKLIQRSVCPSLDVLPSGPKPVNPTELLSSARFAEVLAWAERHYDQVIIDCPPVMAASDAAIIGRQVDGMVIVVQPTKNHRRVVIRAVEQLTSIRVRLVGVVANRVPDNATEYGYGYGYGYGYVTGDEDEPEESAKKDDKLPTGLLRRRAA